MNILIVDDQQAVISGIMTAVDWREMPVEKVFTASSMGEAQLIFRDNPVDILVTDIEMPLGSGIDLVTWVREHHPLTECIFLTSHEDFSYARAALKLGSFDYLLQPIKYDELKRVINNAISKVQERSEIDTYLTYGKYWEENAGNIKERFWFQMLSGAYLRNKTRLDMIGQQLRLSRTDKYLLFLINILRRQVQLSDWDDDLLKHTFVNILEELIYNKTGVLQIVQMDSSHFAILLPLTEDGEIDVSILKQKLQIFVSFYENYLKSSMACYVGNYVQIEKLEHEYQQLVKLEQANVARYQGVFTSESNDAAKGQHFELPEIKLWGQLLESGETAKAAAEITSYFKARVAAGVITPQYLSDFQGVFMDMIWNLAKDRGVKLQEVLADKEIMDRYLNSLYSIENFLDFLLVALSIPERPVMDEQDNLSAVEQVKSFIHDNLDRELSRNEIAEKVYLNPEYLSRLFRKHTGVTLSDYITNERIRVARDYLANTKMPVSIIASKAGYTNFSHFSKIFKKMTGLTPNEYRQHKQGGAMSQ